MLLVALKQGKKSISWKQCGSAEWNTRVVCGECVLYIGQIVTYKYQCTMAYIWPTLRFFFFLLLYISWHISAPVKLKRASATTSTPKRAHSCIRCTDYNKLLLLSSAFVIVNFSHIFFGSFFLVLLLFLCHFIPFQLYLLLLQLWHTCEISH